MLRVDLRFARAVSSLVGTTLGAGMFALPYVISRSGLLLGIAFLLLMGFLSTRLNQFYGKVIVKTEGDHQLSGYARIYLGRWGRLVALFSLIFGIYGALVAYGVQGGNFLSGVTSFSPREASVVFWALLSLLLVLGLHLTSLSELVLTFGVLALLLVLTFWALFRFNPFNLSLSPSTFSRLTPKDVFSNLGVVIFAFGGTSAIPEVEEILRVEHQKLPRAIGFSGVIVLISYLLYSLVVVGACGPSVSQASLDSLAATLGFPVPLLGSTLGVFALGSSYLLLGYALREVFYRDLGISKPVAWFLALFPPFLVLIFSRPAFTSILGITGMLGIGLSWLLVLLIYLRAKASVLY